MAIMMGVGRDDQEPRQKHNIPGLIVFRVGKTLWWRASFLCGVAATAARLAVRSGPRVSARPERKRKSAGLMISMHRQPQQEMGLRWACCFDYFDQVPSSMDPLRPCPLTTQGHKRSVK